MKRRARLLVSGRVQGVCYRMYTCDTARELGLTGTVRNLPDGDVEVVAEGGEAALEELRAWCRQGPPYATVTSLVVDYGPARGTFADFSVVH